MRTSPRRAGALLLALLLTVLCVRSASASSPPRADWPRGVHPWPTGTEWPKGLSGPFDAAAPESVEITSHDGTVLRGALHRPAVPAKVRVPVVVWSSPYFGNLDATVDDPEGEGVRVVPVPVDDLVSAGIAVLSVSVRGTGTSGGCYDFTGIDEQRDQGALIDWAAAQPWSNRRVAMMGWSADGTTALAGAIQGKKALKTVIAIAPVTDYYLMNGTPQGALKPADQTLMPLTYTAIAQAPALHREPDSQIASTAPWLEDPPEQNCPDSPQFVASGPLDVFRAERDQAFYDARRLTDHFEKITASVLITHGFKDTTIQQYAAEATGWAALTKAPKAAIYDQRDHCYPAGDDWTTRAVTWMQFWLQGIGNPPPDLGVVDYQIGDDSDPGACPLATESDNERRKSSAWPPAEAREERLFVADGSLAASPASMTASFVAAPRNGAAPPCAPDGTSAAFETAPMEQDTVIAGNPFAQVEITSSEAEGIIDARLFAVPDGDCASRDVRLLGTGAADLRFLHGNFTAEPFPTGDPTDVRIDFLALAELVREGERVVLVLGGPQAGERVPTRTPKITVGGSSELILPVVSGTVGGTAPEGPYEPRPFLP